jgi:uncharacterized protein (DUF342 family)
MVKHLSEFYDYIIGVDVGSASPSETVIVKIGKHPSKFELLKPLKATPSLLKELLEKAQEIVEAKILAGLDTSGLFSAKNCNYSNTVIASQAGCPSTSEELVSQILRAKGKMDVLNETALIAGHLPGWITKRRWKLAEHLWVARGVFQHNLAAMAELHRLPRWF